MKIKTPYHLTTYRSNVLLFGLIKLSYIDDITIELLDGENPEWYTEQRLKVLPVWAQGFCIVEWVSIKRRYIDED